MDRGIDGVQPVTGRIFIAGGTGFVGTSLRTALAGRPLRLLVRDRAKDASLASADVEVVEGDVTRPETLNDVLTGCEAVISLAAIIEETGGATFDAVIRQGNANLIEAAKRAGVKRYLLMSALGVRNDPAFPYFEAKWQAEAAVKASGIPWTIFRPSVIFGPGDGFINVLADLVRKAPVIPVVGSGQTKFQPIAVEDVAAAYLKALDDPATVGETFELGGPEVLTYERLLDLIGQKVGKRRRKVHVPVGLMMPVVKLAKPLPKALRPPVTEEQLKMLAIDNCTSDSATARLIGREPLRLADGIDYVRR
ncbi:MAG TPA: complex I NDUFA9 subunit family protein [Thermomicrobiales bacterium]